MFGHFWVQRGGTPFLFPLCHGYCFLRGGYVAWGAQGTDLRWNRAECMFGRFGGQRGDFGGFLYPHSHGYRFLRSGSLMWGPKGTLSN